MGKARRPVNDAHLDRLEAETIYVLREAYACVRPLVMLWSMGKDSSALLWMARKAFLGRVPFPLALLDTGDEMDEVYAFRDRYIREWNLDYVNIACPGVETTDPTLPPSARAAARKTEGLKAFVRDRRPRGVILGIRRDEQAVRAKERVFSPRSAEGRWDFRNQPAELWDHYKTELPPDLHVRIHPLLSWSELDVWRYVRREGIPVVDLYFSRNGTRFRSLGEKSITFPVPSTAATLDEIIAELETTQVAERAGRAMDHEEEHGFERLRLDGYM